MSERQALPNHGQTACIFCSCSLHKIKILESVYCMYTLVSMMGIGSATILLINVKCQVYLSDVNGCTVTVVHANSMKDASKFNRQKVC